MTLEKYIAGIKKNLKCEATRAIRCKRNYDCDTCEFVISIDEVPSNEEILGYFEELKSLRVELETYKKALILACKELSYRDCERKRISAPATVRYKQEFLQKAREQESDA